MQKSIGFASALPDGPDMTLDHLLLAEMNVPEGRHAEALALYYDIYLPSAVGAMAFLQGATAAMSDRGHCCLALGRTDEGCATADGTAARRWVDAARHSRDRA